MNIYFFIYALIYEIDTFWFLNIGIQIHQIFFWRGSKFLFERRNKMTSGAVTNF